MLAFLTYTEVARMSKLIVDQRTINDLLSDRKADFLIPDYQRPYAWGDDECGTLWEDLKAFAFPNNSSTEFDSENDEYFLGPIVTFKNPDNKQEVIDGQQRLTTVMLLLRAFYDRFATAKDDVTVETRKLIAKCIWKTDELGRPIYDRLKIESEVASDDDRGEFLAILKEGKIDKGMNSRYAKAFAFFSEKIAQFVDEMAMYTALFPMRILNNVIFLPIETESQDAALRIFSTLNDRGLPLSDADIFKSQFYKFFSSQGRKDEFIDDWKRLEDGANKLFHPRRGTPMDELFTRYMYYRRAKLGIADTTTKSLREFFGENGYEMLKDEQALEDLKDLLGFWQKVAARDEAFSVETQRELFVLSCAPNGMWTFVVSVWFLANRDGEGGFDDAELCRLLRKLIGFVFAYAIDRPGVNALRTPMYPEMVNIVKHKPVEFTGRLFDRAAITANLRAYKFTNQRPVTKSMLTWWAFNDAEQGLLAPGTVLEIEHIYARKRSAIDPLGNADNLEALGNKALLEQRINIRAADYRFCDKSKYYLGSTDGAGKAGTGIAELRRLATEKDDFAEADIKERTELIINAFVDYLGDNGLLA